MVGKSCLGGSCLLACIERAALGVLGLSWDSMYLTKYSGSNRIHSKSLIKSCPLSFRLPFSILYQQVS